MKRTRITNLALVTTLLTALLIGGVAQAQEGNLLLNPGFETPYTGTETVQIAEGWLAWFVPAGEGEGQAQNVPPEFYAASDTENIAGVPRILNGSDAQVILTYFATHTGGLLQNVPATIDQEYVFSVNAYVWSTAGTNPDVSEQPGGVIVQVGIDPAGGMDGGSPNIVWSAPIQRYDAYNEYTVSAIAAAETITAWIRSSVTTPVAFNVITLDDASLVPAGALDATEEATEEFAATDEPAVTDESPVETATEVVIEPTDEIVVPTEEVTEIVPTEETLITDEPVITDEPAVTDAPVITDEPTETPTLEPTATNTVSSESTGVIVTATNTPPPTETPTVNPATGEAQTAVAQTDAALTANAPTSTQIPPTPSPTLDISIYPYGVIHIIVYGDTLYDLALRYGSSIQAILSVNQITVDDVLLPGRQIVIPVRIAPPGGGIVLTAPAPTAAPTSSEPITEYIVRPGDTLSGIASRFSTTVTVLARLNGIVNPNVIVVGRRLRVPTGGTDPATTPEVAPATSTPTQLPPSATPVMSGQTYVVRYGDTLYQIAVLYRVSLIELARANDIENPNLIFVGQVLNIP